MGFHYHTEHRDLIPPNMSGYQWFYYKLTGKDHGSCIICKNNTTFIEASMKYARFCDNPTCKDKYREEFKNRMIQKYGRIHLLNDPEKQKEMLSNRKISGTYNWSDGKGHTDYVGQYELHFLRLLDSGLKWKSTDIIGPSPHTFMYQYNGSDHFYFPDFFIPSMNLQVEIKSDENKNISEESRAKDRIKISLMESNAQYFDFILILNKDYTKFMELIKEE
jgi:hypothetical protein